MSKLSFRARHLDAAKPMMVFMAEDIPDLPDFAAINRAVPQMPTGMEKEEETEHHLQRALSAQQVYGTAEHLVIPIPDISEVVKDRYDKLYKPEEDFKPPKQYIHVQVAFGMEQEIPDYDMDSEDELWLTKQAKKMEVTPLQFENMMDRLEKGSGQMVVTLQEAKALLKEDDDLIIAVYDYWLNKRLRTQHRLISSVKTEKRDGSSSNDPYVAFRRRTEKMQTRKNRKNDETSYEKMLKLRRDLNKALTILEYVKRREKSKKELLKLTVEISEKRHSMQDYSGSALAEALAKRHTLPPFPLQPYNNWQRSETRKKRSYKNRRHKVSTSSHIASQGSMQIPQYNEVDVLHTYPDSSDDDMISPLSPAEEVEDDPDGVYAFKRKANCSYHAPLQNGYGNWPWLGRDEGGTANPRYRFNLMSLSRGGSSIGFGRRRVGRGGRVIIDRAFTEWDDHLQELNIGCDDPPPSPTSPEPKDSNYLQDLLDHIKKSRIHHYRPSGEINHLSSTWNHSSQLIDDGRLSPEFNADSFHLHKEQLRAMKHYQLEQISKQDTSSSPSPVPLASDLDNSFDLDHSFSSQPTSRFTLDSASARFAASALCSNTKDLSSHTVTEPTVLSAASNTTVSTVSSTSNTNGNAALANGPVDVGVTGNMPQTTGVTIVIGSTAGGTTASTSTTTVIATNPTNLPNSASSPSLLKLAAASQGNNKDSLKVSKENNLVKDQGAVAMEVT